MRKQIQLVTVLAIALVGGSAGAADGTEGNVPPQLLQEMGLAQMEVLSDQQGEEIRGAGVIIFIGHPFFFHGLHPHFAHHGFFHQPFFRHGLLGHKHFHTLGKFRHFGFHGFHLHSFSGFHGKKH